MITERQALILRQMLNRPGLDLQDVTVEEVESLKGLGYVRMVPLVTGDGRIQEGLWRTRNDPGGGRPG